MELQNCEFLIFAFKLKYVPTFELVGYIKTFILRAIALEKSRARRIWKVICAVRTTHCNARFGASITLGNDKQKIWREKKKTFRNFWRQAFATVIYRSVIWA